MPDIEGVPYEATGGKIDQATAQALAARHREAASAGVGAASAAIAPVQSQVSALSSRVDKTLVDAKAYTDQKVTGLATTVAMQAGDQKSLTDAKAYTDGKVDDLDPLPADGTAGQVLTKTSDGSAWQDSPTGLPSGGSTGQVLTKTSDGSAWAAGPLANYILTGPGRPDTPATTAGTITGSEPVGAEYRSTDGAGVGAYVWMKRPGGKWHVTNGDSGWREVTAETWVHETNTYAVPGGTRMGTVIRLTTAGMDLIVRGAGGSANPGVAIAANQHLRIPVLRSLLPAQFTWNSYSSLPHGLQEYYGDISIQWGRAPAAVWFLPRDPAAWPTTLPGTPA